MPIASSDILFKTSVTSGSAGNSVANSTPGTSLGKYISTTQVVDAALDNLFPDLTGDENAASNIDYQCLFIHNAHATLTFQNVVVWLSAEVAGGAILALGADTTAVSALSASSAQALQIADKNTAPAGVTFSAPTSKATGIALGDIGPGQVKAVWVRRTATNSAAQSNDGGTIRVEGDTVA